MNIRWALIAFIIIIAVGSLLYFFSPEDRTSAPELYKIDPIEIGRAGNYGYIVYEEVGNGVFSALVLGETPIKTVYLYTDVAGIGMEKIEELLSDLKELESYGIEVVETKFVVGADEGELLVVPQGAMPDPVLTKLKNQELNKVLYIGKDDLIVKNGVQTYSWYSELTDKAKEKVIIVDENLEELYQKSQINEFISDILYNRWSLVEEYAFSFSGSKDTEIVSLDKGNYIRIIYPTEEGMKVKDSESLEAEHGVIEIKEVFPWENAQIYFSLNRTKGTPTLYIYKDGTSVYEDKLKYVSSENVFYDSLKFEAPGNYIVRVEDYEGTPASGIIHVKELEIVFLGATDYLYEFSVNIDDKPVKEIEVLVNLNNSSEKKKYTVLEGRLSIPASLEKGMNVFNIEVYETVVKVPVENIQESLFDVYSKYGPWAVLILLVVYGTAKIARKPVYKLKFSDARQNSPREIKTSKKDLFNIFKKAIRKYGIMDCISIHEFSLALKEGLTDGYDVIEGNVEDALKKMKEQSLIDSYDSYYIIKDGDTKKIVLNRMIQEKLMEHGINFKFVYGIFEANGLEIGLPGSKFKKKRRIVIFENKVKIDGYVQGLPEMERAEITLKIKNDLLILTTIQGLDEYL